MSTWVFTWTDLKLLAPLSKCHSTVNLQTQCSFFSWVPWPCSRPMLESSLSHCVSSGTSKVSVIKEALDIYWWQEWVSGWIGEWMNGVTQLQYWELFVNFAKSWYLRKFFSLSFLHIFFSDRDFLLSASFSLSCAFSRNFPILWNCRLISVYCITSQQRSDWWIQVTFCVYFLKTFDTGCITKRCQVCFPIWKSVKRR